MCCLFCSCLNVGLLIIKLSIELNQPHYNVCVHEPEKRNSKLVSHRFKETCRSSRNWSKTVCSVFRRNLFELQVSENVKHANNVVNAMHQSANQHPAWDVTCRGKVWPFLLPEMSLINHMIRRDLCFFMDDNSSDGQLRMLQPRLAKRRRQSLQERYEGQSLVQIQVQVLSQVRINPGQTSLCCGPYRFVQGQSRCVWSE